MNSMKKNKRWLAVGTALLALTLAACATSEEDAAPKDSSTEVAENEASENYPITIPHALGETVIEQKPERVATIAWANHDIALALGVAPVGFSAANYGVEEGKTILPWTEEKLKELGVDSPNVYQDTDGLDFEAIADSNPDVILAAYSGLTQEEYDTLTQIAPVIAYQETPWVTSWRDQVKFNSMAMGLEAEGEQLIADTEKLIQNKANEYSDIQGKKAAFAMFTVTDLSKFYVYTPADPRGEFLVDLGMPYPESLQTLATDEESFYLELSAEHADALADVELFIAYGDDSTLAALQADPILGQVPAIKAGNVAIIEDNTPLAAAGNPNPLSIEYTIDDYLTIVSDVAKNVK